MDGLSYLLYSFLWENFDFILRIGCNKVYLYFDYVIFWLFSIFSCVFKEIRLIC